MTFNLPPKVRFAIYVATGVLQPVAVYLLAKDIIGEVEMALFSAEAAFAGVLAALNTNATEGEL